MANQVDIFVCRRGFNAGVEYCGCGNRAVKQCDYKLRGNLHGEVCGKLLCPRCATPAGQGAAPGVCGVHAPVQEAWDPTQRPRRSS